MSWQKASRISSKTFKCGHCGFNVASDQGFIPTNSGEGNKARLFICPHCDGPAYFNGAGRQFPAPAPGNEVQHLPTELEALYREARNCCAVSAYTASVLASRKMLMSIAVQQGAKEGGSFVDYVEYLAQAGFIPPHGKGWVDHIRKKGNEATHEIALMGDSDAADMITFTEMLLKFVYEFPRRVPGP